MKKLISVCGIIAFATMAAACTDRESTTVRETVQTRPADPVVVQKETTTKTTDSIETDD
jgi:hypothetical protein